MFSTATLIGLALAPVAQTPPVAPTASATPGETVTIEPVRAPADRAEAVRIEAELLQRVHRHPSVPRYQSVVDSFTLPTDLPAVALTPGGPSGLDGVERWRMEIAPGVAFHLYTDAVGTAAAPRFAPVIAEIARRVAQTAGVPVTSVRWDDLILVGSQETAQRIARSGKGKWPIVLNADGTIGINTITALTGLVPHELAHRANPTTQLVNGAPQPRTPLWFGEGHADWIEGVVAASFPEFALARRYSETAERLSYGAVYQHVDVGNFRRGRPTDAAIQRQVSAEEFAEYKRTGRLPPRQYTFSPAELDQSNFTGAHYFGAGSVFRFVERRAGRAAAMLWIAALAAMEGPLTTERIVAAAEREAGVDIRPLLQPGYDHRTVDAA